MKENFIKKIISPCILVICMIVVMMFAVTPTKASDASDESIKVETITGYTAESLNTMIDTQATNGYLYAGLFKADTTADNLTKKNVVASPKDGSTYVAKFVPEGVMGIKAQVSSALLSNSDLTASSVRMVTAVDSLTYKEIGFSITRVGSDGQTIELVEQATITPYVYEKLYGVDVTVNNPGEPMEYTPKDIHALANYFKTYTIKNVPDSAYNTELTVVPYWKTFDGKTVHGTTGVKSVNLGRSWIYVNASANTDGNQYGTNNHPYTSFATALDNIVLDNNGKILLQSDYTEASDFNWEGHGKDITIAGVQGTETLDFSQLSAGSINDGVTFASMILKLRTGNVYACGNSFTIAEDVVSDNLNTVIYGGAYGTSVEKTNVTILAGSYRAVYGGGATGGTVTGDTHVTIKNSNIYNTSTSHDSRVHGGGNKAIVEGNTYVTIGEGFNAGLGDNYASSSMHSTVYGGGYGAADNVATVKGDTQVTIEGDARVNYVFGAGGPQSAVEGTSRILFKDGYAMGLYGGANGSGTNSHTLVKMTGGQVEQIFGGNQSTLDNSMAGSSGEKLYADVQVLGGTVTRRIYGGCYNEYEWSWKTTNSVEGYTSVTIASEATVPSGNVCANSRLGTKSENEIGVLVLNQGIGSGCIGRDVGSSLCTNFLVEVPEGGIVTSENGLLNIATDTGNGYNFATVTYAGETLCVVEGKGKYPLPTLNNTTSIQDIEVTFSKESPTTDGFEAKNVTGTDGVYYPTFEEAMNMAEEGTNVVVLQNINVDKAYTIEKDLTISSESSITITKAATLADNMFTVTSGRFSIKGAADATITLEGNKDADEAVGARAINVKKGATCNANHVTIQNFSIDGEGGAIYAAGGSNVIVTNCKFTNNIASTGAGALRIISGATVTSDNSIYFGNKTTSSDKGNGGAILCHGTYNDINSSYLNNTSARHGGALIVQDGGVAMLAGTDSNAMFSGNTASANANGNTVYVNGGATVNITGYSFADDTQKMLAAGTLTFGNITGATIVQGSAGKIYVAGYDAEANMVEVKPKEYAIGTEVLQQAESLTDDSVFQVACEDITVTTDADNNYWWIKSDGTLMQGVARIETEGENTYYNSLSSAVNAANTDGGTGDADDIVIYVYKDVALSGQIAITKNIVIQNEPGETVAISRGTAGVTENMFYIGNSNNNLAAKLTLGSNETSELGALIINGGTATTGRIVENRATATFILGRNATLQNTSNTNWGAVLCNRGTAELNGIVKENTCEHAGGAIIQVQVSGKAAPSMRIVQGEYTDNMSKFSSGNSWGGVIRVDAGTLTIEGGNFANNSVDKLGGVVYAAANTEVTITGGTFSGNTAGGEGSAIYCLGTLSCKDAIFEGETEQTIYANDEFTFDNITGATIVQGAGATLNVAGYDVANVITVTPNAYTAGVQLLNKVSGVEDAIFEAACAGIKVTLDADNNDWWIDSDGVLMKGEARIGDTYYNTLSDAVDVVNADDSISTDATIVIELLRDVVLNEQIKIQKNITIQNVSGQNINITRGEDATSVTLFYVTGALTLGTNVDAETGKLVVDGENTSVTSRFIDNRAGATFVLGKNATLQNANSNQWGAALCNRGTATLYGDVKNNICTGDGGAIIQVGGRLTIVEGEYAGNKSTNESTTNPHGAVLRATTGEVIIQGGRFTNNSTVGLGSVIHSTVAVTITGGTFSNNTSSDDSALYCTGTLSCTDAAFEGETKQTIYANGTFTFNNITGATIAQGANANIYVAGYEEENVIELTPYTYTEGTQVLQPAESLGDDTTLFVNVCAGINVTPEEGNYEWYIEEEGKLAKYEASITEDNVTKYYKTLSAAVSYANENGGTGETDNTVINILKDVMLTETLDITKNIQIQNEPGREVNILRGSLEADMFNVTAGKLSLGNSADSEELIVDGTSESAVSGRTISTSANVVIYKNTLLLNANSKLNGGAIYVSTGTVELIGATLRDNTGYAGGAIRIESKGKVIATNAVFDGNKSANTNNGGAISCAGLFEDTNGRFVNNVSTKHGGALIVMSGGTAILTQDENATDETAAFSNNSAASGYKGGAIFINSGGTVTINGKYTFNLNSPVDIHVGGTLNYDYQSEITTS